MDSALTLYWCGFGGYREGMSPRDFIKVLVGYRGKTIPTQNLYISANLLFTLLRLVILFKSVRYRYTGEFLPLLIEGKDAEWKD